MTTAKKIDQRYPVLRTWSTEFIESHSSTQNDRIHPLITESKDIFSMMGWEFLPESIKLSIAIDMIGFRDELNGLYSSRDPRVLARRKSIYFWVHQFADGKCTSETATKALRVMNLV
jgi:hypothetical protein